MPLRKTRQVAEQHTFVAIRVEHYDADAEAGLNINLVTSRPFDDMPEDFVFESSARLVITGVACYPMEREGETYEVTLVAKDSHGSRLQLKDIQARDEHHSPVYRQYRGAHFPVYKAPLGLSTIERRRPDGTWQAYVTVQPQLTTDMLIQLSQNRQLYLEIHEMKAERRRWIRSIALKSTNPADE
jgi:hypothetical protein